MHRDVILYQPINPKIEKLVEAHGFNPEALSDILVDLQRTPEGLTTENLEDVARALNVPAARVQGLAGFYSMLATDRPDRTLRICDGPACWLANTGEVGTAGLNPEGWRVERTSCLGLCDRAPAALAAERQVGPLTPALLAGAPGHWEAALPDYSRSRPGEVRVLLEGAGSIDSRSIDSALAHGVYRGLEAALAVDPAGLLEEIESSGLIGHGGAGFPTGRKWRIAAEAPGDPKYIICNADESEPLSVKDRVLMDANPHRILEGMAVAARAVGAGEGLIYIRGEYEAQAVLLEHAIAQAEERGWLGGDVQGSGFSFKVRLHRGAGAYICGEETALIESLEGRRGEPRLRPPYPVTHGYRGRPTVVNNVETLAKVPHIILNGADWYQDLSPGDRAGTKIYAVLGHIRKPGVFEAPIGLSLRQIIDDFGGGMRDGSQFYFALAGGAAGRLAPPGLLDVPVDYASGPQGIHIGVGAFLVCDTSVSPIQMLREVFHFFEAESCGKCTPCRVGTQRVRALLDQILTGRGRPEMLAELGSLAVILESASFCGLGSSAAWPLQSVLDHFGDELQAAVSVSKG